MARELPRGWTKSSKYSIARGVYSIAMVRVGGEARLEVWAGKDLLSWHTELDAALDEAKRHESGLRKGDERQSVSVDGKLPD